MKRGKFFCENCGTEVRPNAKVCPHCGRFFRAVRCPVCSFTGESMLFLQGCPNCGYAGGEGREKAAGSGFEVYNPDELEDIGQDDGRGVRYGASSRSNSPPPWLYWLIFGTLLVAFGILALIYINL